VQEQEREDAINTNGKQVSKQDRVTQRVRMRTGSIQGLLHRPTRRLYQPGPRHGFACVKVRWRGEESAESAESKLVAGARYIEFSAVRLALPSARRADGLTSRSGFLLRSQPHRRLDACVVRKLRAQSGHIGRHRQGQACLILDVSSQFRPPVRPFQQQ
jgi:hypothetical protein